MAKLISQSNLGTAPDTYLYTLSRFGDTFATIGSDDTLRLFDITLKQYKSVHAAHTGLSCLTSHSSGFVTAGRDGQVSFWDPRAQRANFSLREPGGRGFSALACRDHVVLAGTESTKEGLGDVSVSVYDTRNPSSPVRNYVESHTDSITQLAFHPSEGNLVLSGSTDGLVSIFDVSIEEEEDALQQVLNPRSAVHCAGFLSASEAYVVTTDEQFSVHSLGETGGRAALLEFGDVRENLGCMYVVDVVVDGAGPVVMAYGHNVDQTLGVVELDAARSYGFGRKVDLPGAHGEEVVRDLMVLRQEGRAMSCGEDGQVRVWDLSTAGGSSGMGMDVH